jgi:hypothetical protein
MSWRNSQVALLAQKYCLPVQKYLLASTRVQILTQLTELADLVLAEAAGILDKSVYYAAKAKLMATAQEVQEAEEAREEAREEASASQDTAQREQHVDETPMPPPPAVYAVAYDASEHLNATHMPPSPASALQVSHEDAANILARVAAMTDRYYTLPYAAEDDANAPPPRSLEPREPALSQLPLQRTQAATTLHGSDIHRQTNTRSSAGE